MGYISTERVSEIRKELKAKFKDIKFSITREHGSTIAIAIMEANFHWEKSYESINTYYLENYENSDLFRQIVEIANKDVKRYETSDYGSQPSHYVDFTIGKWNKPYKHIAK